MAQPISIINTIGQSTDTIYATDGTGRLKIAIGSVAGSLTPALAWAGVATHQDGDTINAGDGVVVGAGVDGGGIVRKILVDAAGRLVVGLSPSTGTLTDKSGTITAGNTQQTLAATNTARKYLFIQNIDPAEDLWINFTTNAVLDEPSIRLGPGDTFVMENSYVSSERVSVNAATTGHKWTAKEG